MHAGSSLAQRSSACFVSMTAKFNLIFLPNPIPDMGQHFTLSAGPVQIMAVAAYTDTAIVTMDGE